MSANKVAPVQDWRSNSEGTVECPVPNTMYEDDSNGSDRRSNIRGRGRLSEAKRMRSVRTAD